MGEAKRRREWIAAGGQDWGVTGYRGTSRRGFRFWAERHAREFHKTILDLKAKIEKTTDRDPQKSVPLHLLAALRRSMMAFRPRSR